MSRNKRFKSTRPVLGVRKFYKATTTYTDLTSLIQRFVPFCKILQASSYIFPVVSEAVLQKFSIK